MCVTNNASRCAKLTCCLCVVAACQVELHEQQANPDSHDFLHWLNMLKQGFQHLYCCCLFVLLDQENGLQQQSARSINEQTKSLVSIQEYWMGRIKAWATKVI